MNKKRLITSFMIVLIVLPMFGSLSRLVYGWTENITNGGFETGDFTGWTRNGGIAYIDTTSPYSGTYLCVMNADYIIQDFGEEGISFSGISDFGFYYKNPSVNVSNYQMLWSGTQVNGVIPDSITDWTHYDLLTVIHSQSGYNGSTSKIFMLVIGDWNGTISELKLDNVVLNDNPASDTTPPNYSDVSYSRRLTGLPCLLSSSWTDNVAMSGFIVGNNNTGTFINQTWTSTSGYASYNIPALNDTVGNHVSFEFWGNDTNNNWNSTGLYTLLVSPTGEYITNGGFETGDITGWSLADGVVQSGTKHSGSYACQIYPSGDRKLNQTLNYSIFVSDIQAFTMWSKSFISYVQIDYSDSSYTRYYPSDTGSWVSTDLKASLDSGKTVIDIQIIGGSSTMSYIDDISLLAGITDTTPPVWSSVVSHGRASNTNASIISVWTDDIQLDRYSIETNNTGTPMNSTWVIFNGSASTFSLVQLNSTVGVTVSCRVFANDTSNNMNVTSYINITTTYRDMNFEGGTYYFTPLSDFDSYSGSIAVASGSTHTGSYGLNITSSGQVNYNRSIPFYYEAYFWLNIQTNLSTMNTVEFAWGAISSGYVVWSIRWYGNTLYAEEFPSTTTFTMTNDIQFNVWYKIGVIYDDSGFIHFIFNGIDVGSITLAYYPTTEIDFGTHLFNSQPTFNVWLDDVWFYSIENIPPEPTSISVIPQAPSAVANYTVGWESIANTLSGYILETNVSGILVNESWVQVLGSPSSETVTAQQANPSLLGTVVIWRMLCNDSLNQMGDTGWRYFTVSVSSVTSLIYTPNTGSVKFPSMPDQTSDTISVYWSGNDLLVSYYYEMGISASYGWNFPSVNLPVGTTSAWTNFTRTFVEGEAVRIFWNVWLLDTSGYSTNYSGVFEISPQGCTLYNNFEIQPPIFSTDIYNFTSSTTYGGYATSTDHGYGSVWLNYVGINMNSTWAGVQYRRGMESLKVIMGSGFIDEFSFYRLSFLSNPMYIRFSFYLDSIPNTESHQYIKLFSLTDFSYNDYGSVSHAGWLNHGDALDFYITYGGGLCVAYYNNGYPITQSLGLIVHSGGWYDIAIGIYQENGNGWVSAITKNGVVFNMTGLKNTAYGLGYVWFGATMDDGFVIFPSITVYEDCFTLYATYPTSGFGLSLWGENVTSGGGTTIGGTGGYTPSITIVIPDIRALLNYFIPLMMLILPSLLLGTVMGVGGVFLGYGLGLTMGVMSGMMQVWFVILSIFALFLTFYYRHQPEEVSDEGGGEDEE